MDKYANSSEQNHQKGAKKPKIVGKSIKGY